MTTAEALARVKAAKPGDISVNPDDLNFRGWSTDAARDALLACTSCAGDRDAFVFDGYITVTFFAGLLFITGIGRSP